MFIFIIFLKEKLLNLMSTNNTSNENKNDVVMENLDKIFLCEKCNTIPYIQLIFNYPQPTIYIKCESCGINNSITLQKFLEYQIEKNESKKLDKINDLICKFCEKNKPIKFCLYCMRLFCEDCLNNHHNDKKYENHIILDREINLFKKCKDHLGNHQKFYCNTCKTGLCNECMKNKEHSNHQINNIQNIFKSYDDNLIEQNIINQREEFKNNLKEKVNLYITFIEKKINELNQYKTNIENELEYSIKQNNIILDFMKKLLDNYRITKPFSNYNSYLNLLSHSKFSKINIPDLNEKKEVIENYNIIIDSLKKQSIIISPENILIYKNENSLTLPSKINNLIQINDCNIAISMNNIVEIYDIKTFKKIKSIPGHQGKINCLNLLTKNTFISGGNDGRIYLWSTSYPFMINGAFEESKKPIDCVSIGTNSNEIYSISLKGEIMKLDTKNYKCTSRKELKIPFSDAINCGIYQIFIFKEIDKIFKFSFVTQIIQMKNDIENIGSHNKVNLLYNINNDLFASSSLSLDIKIWSSKTNKCVRSFFGFQEKVVNICNNYFFLFALGEKNEIKCWDLNKYDSINVKIPFHFNKILYMNETYIFVVIDNVIHCFVNHEKNLLVKKEYIYFLPDT